MLVELDREAANKAPEFSCQRIGKLFRDELPFFNFRSGGFHRRLPANSENQRSRLDSRCCKTWRLQGHPDSMFCEVRTMFCVMAPPCAVIVPEVMIWICGVNPQHNF